MINELTLQPRHRYNGYESIVPHCYGPSVTILQSHCNAYRFLTEVNGVFVSCLIIDNALTINSVYTLPEYRRRGIAKQLLVVAKLTIGAIYHSSHLTESGEAWRNSVETLHKC